MMTSIDLTKDVKLSGLLLSSHPHAYWFSSLEGSLSEAHLGTQASHAFLLSFQASAQPFQLASYILTQKEANPLSFFYTIQLIRKAVIAEWKITGEEEIDNLKSLLFSFLLHHLNLPSFIQRSALHTIAIIIKRQWITNSRNQILQYIHSSYRSLLSTLPILGIEFLSSIISEFNSTKASAIGMSLEKHFNAHRSFETEGLLSLFILTHDNLQSLSAISTPPLPLLTSTLNLLESILSWDFEADEKSSLTTKILEYKKDGSIIDGKTAVKPGREWTNVLILPTCTLMSLLLSIYTGLIHNRIDHTPAHRSILNSLLHLCSLKGSIYPDSETQTSYLSSLLSIFPPLLSSLSFSHSSITYEFELPLILMMYHRIFTTFTINSLLLLVDSSSFLSNLHILTRSIILHPSFLSHTFSSSSATALSESLDIALDCWVHLVFIMDEETHRNDQNTTNAIYSFIDDIFSLYVTRRIVRTKDNKEILEECKLPANERINDIGYKDEEEENDQFHGNEYEDDHLRKLSTFARIHPNLNLSALTSLLFAHIQQWQKSITQSKANNNQEINFFPLHESLLFLYRLSGRVVTDPYEGETPLIPSSLLSFSLSNAFTPQNDPLVQLLNVLLSYGQTLYPCLQNGWKQYLSPVVTTSVIECYISICHTYICIDRHLYLQGVNDDNKKQQIKENRILNLYSEDSNETRKIISSWMDLILIIILTWNEEEDIIELAIKLFRTMSSNSTIRTILVDTSSYCTLLNIYRATATIDPYNNSVNTSATTQQAKLLLNLSRSQLGGLVECLMLSVTSEKEFNWLVEPSQHRHIIVVESSLFQSRGKEQSVIDYITVTLAMLTHISSVPVPSIFDHAILFHSSLYDPLLSLFRHYGSTSAHICEWILSWFTSVATVQFVSMKQLQAERFLQSCVILITLYEEINNKRIQLVATSPIKTRNHENELWEDIHLSDTQLLLTLLHRLITSSDSYSLSQQIIDTSYQASLHCLSLLASSNNFILSLSDKNINVLYYLLLSETLSTHTILFAKLSEEKRDIIIKTIILVIKNEKNCFNEEIIRYALSSIRSIATFHHHQIKQLQNKKPVSVDFQVSQGRMINTKTELFPSDTENLVTSFDTVLPMFLSLLFEFLLFSSSLSSTLLDILSDTLLPVLIEQMNNYIHIASYLLNNWSLDHSVDSESSIIRHRLEQGFKDLISSGGVKSDLNATNRQIFRKNIKHFFETVRILLHAK